jgi:ABC-type sugar transport system ATPase subunit
MTEIRVENLSKTFGNFTALKALNMTFPAGTVTCLLGPSGCGKTTLMRIMAGLESPTTGDVYFGNQRVTNRSTRDRNIGMVFQYPVVYRGLSVRENIELPLLEDRALSASERAKRIDEVLDILEMRDAADKDLSQLDNGTRQKVACARQVARRPSIILFDEPITNVDINAKLQLKRALKELFTRLKQTIIYVTHDQTEAMTLADNIALMRDGVIAQMAHPRELYDKPNDAFAGFFLGNPGMNFYEGVPLRSGIADSPLFAGRTALPGSETIEGQVVLGIRPEHVLVSNTQTPGAVRCKILNRSIVTGGQYLIGLQVGALQAKAKISGPAGAALTTGSEAWAEFPVTRVRVFNDTVTPAAAT